MSRYDLDTIVSVYPFVRQVDQGDWIIGRTDTAVFLVVPADALELLDHLASGMTVGEARNRYESQHGEVPDLEDFLGYLEQEGFVLPKAENFQTTSLGPAAKHYHFTGISQKLAQGIFSQPVITLLCGLIVTAIGVAISHPHLIPDWHVHYFEHNITLMRLSIALLWYAAVFLHEMAHLVAARSVGVPSRLGLGQRMWYWVAETDMTGMWAVPREKRYLPYLAGPLVDAASAALLLLTLFGESQKFYILDPTLAQLAKAMLLTYLMALLWQCYFFMQTDVYYVVANFFHCKNLMEDTRTYLSNQRHRFTGKGQHSDQSHIPDREMKVIRGYAWVWAIGRAVALFGVLLVTLPLIVNYFLLMLRQGGIGWHGDLPGLIDLVFMWTTLIAFQASGVYFWARKYVEKWPAYIWLRRSVVSWFQTLQVSR
jgi:putative peptide zinc metalloprotease protein